MLPFAATWMDLEGIMLSAVSQREKGKYCMISLTPRIQKIQQTSEYNKKEADSQREQTSGSQLGERRDSLGVGE